MQLIISCHRWEGWMKCKILGCSWGLTELGNIDNSIFILQLPMKNIGKNWIISENFQPCQLEASHQTLKCKGALQCIYVNLEYSLAWYSTNKSGFFNHYLLMELQILFIKTQSRIGEQWNSKNNETLKLNFGILKPLGVSIFLNVQIINYSLTQS